MTAMLTPPEVAKLLGVSLRTVRIWIETGELRAVNVSANRQSRKPRLRISQEALAEFQRVREGKPSPTAAPKRRKFTRPIERFI